MNDLARMMQGWRGDFADHDLVDGRLRLTPAEVAELDAQADVFLADARWE